MPSITSIGRHAIRCDRVRWDLDHWALVGEFWVGLRNVTNGLVGRWVVGGWEKFRNWLDLSAVVGTGGLKGPELDGTGLGDETATFCTCALLRKVATSFWRADNFFTSWAKTSFGAVGVEVEGRSCSRIESAILAKAIIGLEWNVERIARTFAGNLCRNSSFRKPSRDIVKLVNEIQNGTQIDYELWRGAITQSRSICNFWNFWCIGTV